jgi:hypothetical protein
MASETKTSTVTAENAERFGIALMRSIEKGFGLTQSRFVCDYGFKNSRTSPRL